ncbi:globin [Fulvimonas soli]|jgi:hemoglobin-like flavoprotein|uniref:Hemoglobin-like flavoprotein n=1 Tax=Fulvimonas soli TaxID=155197 RepID=A0A316HYN0_9GAMM|nr:globin [Fulvimonas soli]PWK85798.1 hemoglobin-like flavoprotein [Fulvimonas soli]TNY25741.1 globin [Fulvimonas soli]
MSESYDDLQASYGRCLRNGRFIERFYAIFMGSHPDIVPMFAHTDFSRQYMALRRGISSAIAHAAGSRLAERTMTEMARVHGRAGRAPVPPALYPYWVDSLLQAVAEHDPQYTPALGRRWREAMEATTAFFTGHY